MDIWEENKLLIFIGFVIPGFIAIKAYELLSPSREIDTSKLIIDAVSYSCFNYAILLWPISLVETRAISVSHPNLYILFYFSVLFVSPVLLALFWRFLREMEFIQKFIPHPTQKPWDFVFGKRCFYWVIVTLKNGEKIGGMYGPSSFSSSAPASEQIFLEEVWLLNSQDRFERKVEQTSGVIVTSEILKIEFFHSGDEKDAKRPEE